MYVQFSSVYALLELVLVKKKKRFLEKKNASLLVCECICHTSRVFIGNADQKELLMVVWVYILLSSQHCVVLKLPASDDTPLHRHVIFLTRLAQGQRNGLFIDPERCHTIPCV